MCKWIYLLCSERLDDNSLSRAELEHSVSGDSGAIFRSFSSLTEANTKFGLFIQSVTEMFSNVVDPFSVPGSSALHPARHDSPAGDTPQAPAVESVALPSVTRGPPETQPQAAGPSTQRAVTVQNEQALGPIAKSILRRVRAGAPGRTDGWYVVFHGAIPGVCFGS